jgi:predicted nucleotidyltransferase
MEVLMQPQEDVQQRFEAALDVLVEKLKQDYYVLAAVVYGSVARGEAWEKSDIDLTIIQRDKLERESRYFWLAEDGVNISAYVVSRSRFRRMMDGALQGSFAHAVRSHAKLLFSKDESITAWLEETDRIGTRDQEFQLLRVASLVPPLLDKAEKWFYVKDDLHYSFVWIMYAVNELARVEVVLNGRAPGREVIHQALKYNPSFFKVVYTDLIDGPKDRQAIQQALALFDAYLEERADRLFKPVLDYLAEADGMRTALELDAHFRKKVQGESLFWSYEWLARKGIIAKVAAPVRLTKKSQVTLEEPAYYYDGDVCDWE